MRMAGCVKLQWLDDVSLCVTFGDFDDEAAAETSGQMLSSIDQYASDKFAFLGITSLDHAGGSLSSPEALVCFWELVSAFYPAGMQYATLVNASAVADESYGELRECRYYRSEFP